MRHSFLPINAFNTWEAVSAITRPLPASPFAIEDRKPLASFKVTCGGNGTTSGSVLTSSTPGRSLASARCQAERNKSGVST
jgi:hypothetical protein